MKFNHISDTGALCEFCGGLYPSGAELRNHTSLWHISEEENTRPSSDLMCTFCSVTFSTRPLRDGHARLSHPQEVAENWLTCNLCNLYLPDLDSLHEHGKDHERLKGSQLSGKPTLIISSPLAESNTHDPKPSTSNAVTESPRNEPDGVRLPPESLPQQLFDQPEPNNPGESNAASPRVESGNEAGPDLEVLGDPRPQLSCHCCLAEFGDHDDFYHHSNQEHREEIARTWHPCQSCLWYLPSKRAVRRHLCLGPLIRAIGRPFCPTNLPPGF